MYGIPDRLAAGLLRRRRPADGPPAASPHADEAPLSAPAGHR
ncbi:hypothetical protein ABZ214_38860 [Streptomyces iakyrus]